MLTMGSGGHTAEMLYMSQRYNFDKFDKVYLVLTETDTFSKKKAIHHWEDNKVNLVINPQVDFPENKKQWVVLPPSRNNKQGAFSSIVTTVKSLV